MNYVWIAAGGALGSVLRFALQNLVQRWAGASPPAFPAGTLAVNVLGCFAIGLASALFAGPLPVREEYRLGLTVGILGGFTTFSAFGLQTVDLAAARQVPLAMANVLLSCGLGLAAVWCGHRLVHWWWDL